MLRIIHQGYRTVATIDLDGKLIGPWVDELRRTVAARRHDEGLRLNLEHLGFADAAGIALLRELQQDGVQLMRASPLIEGLLATQRDTDWRALATTGSQR